MNNSTGCEICGCPDAQFVDSNEFNPNNGHFCNWCEHVQGYLAAPKEFWVQVEKEVEKELALRRATFSFEKK